MLVPDLIDMPKGAKEQIRAILPFATRFTPSMRGGWVINFQMAEDHANWKIDKKFLSDNNLSLSMEKEEDNFHPLLGKTRPDYIYFELKYTPQK